VKSGQTMPTTTGTTLASIAFDAIGRVDTITYSTGVVATQSYDSFGRASGVSYAKSGTTLMSDAVTRDLSGRITDQTLDGNDANTSGANFTYDNAGRLTGWYVKDPSTSTTYHGTEGYSYSGGSPSDCSGKTWGNATTAGLNSNRVESTLQVNGGSTATTKYCYDYADRIQKVVTPGGQTNPYAAGFAYDAHGNATSVGNETRVYDGADRHVGTQTGTITTAKTALVVVGVPGTLTSRDSWVRDQLQDDGWTVTIADDNGITAAAATGKQLVVVTDSVSSSTVGNTFKTTAVPVIVSEAFILDDMGMTGTGGTDFGNTAADQTQITITTAGETHPLGAGLYGTITTTTSGISHAWGKPASAATKAASIVGDATKSTIFGYDTGATMSSGTAAARRVGWFQYEGASSLLTANAAVLFRAAVDWAANLPTQPSAIVVVGNPGSLTTRDSWFRDRLQDAGWSVSMVDDTGITASAADGKQLVVITDSVGAATVGNTFKTTAVPVVVTEAFILDDMGMTGTTSGTDFGSTGIDQTQIAITTAGETHPLGAGFPAGNLTTSTSAITHNWGKPAGAAIVAATLPSDATKAAIFGYDIGATMSSGTAPARRVGYFHYEGNTSLLNTNATALFDATITWAAQTTPTIRYTRDATDRIVQRDVNSRTEARYSYTASGDTSDLTLNSSSNLVEATIALPGGALYTWRSATPVWSHPNLHGDLALTTNTSGTKQGPTRIWNPWGQLLTTTADQDNSTGELDYGWHGNAQRPVEHQTGALPTIEMGARQYDPVLGRFLTVDPIEGGTSNDYVYPEDPLNSSDLSGERFDDGTDNRSSALSRFYAYVQRRFNRSRLSQQRRAAVGHARLLREERRPRVAVKRSEECEWYCWLATGVTVVVGGGITGAVCTATIGLGCAASGFLTGAATAAVKTATSTRDAGKTACAAAVGGLSGGMSSAASAAANKFGEYGTKAAGKGLGKIPCS